MDETKKIGVIGAGSFGTALAMTLSGKGHAVTLWARRPEQVADMRKTHQNMHYLPDVTLPEALQFTDDLQDAVQGKDLLLLTVPSQTFRDVFTQVAACMDPQIPVVNAAKGIEKGSLLRLSEVAQQIMPDVKYAALSGPSHAEEVAEEIRRLAKYMHGVKVLPIYGGQEIGRQIRSLKDGVQVIIGTPGRVMDHMRRKTVKMDQIHTVVLDEADEMLNMGFLEDMETILSALPEERQTLMFSATMPQAIQRIAANFQKDPQIVRVVKKELTVPKVTQYYYEVKPKNKLEVMCRLLDLYDPKLSVVFCNTKKQVDELVQGLQGRGYFAEGLHGDLKQEQRDRVMRAFRTGRTDILVATDVAARGIDVDDVEAVFNYDVPQDDEYYVHRIGRTGRAGREGKAFNLVVGKEVYKLREIQRYCKTRIIPQAIPSLDDVTSIKADKILDQVGEVLQDSDLSKVIDIVEKRVLEEDYTTLDLAAALLKMMMGEEGEELLEENRPLRELEDLEDESRRSRGGRNGRGSRGRNEDVARLFINIGKNQGIRPGDILGAIAGESGMPGRMVGSIDMFDNYTFVEVPREHADVVLQAMRGAKIKGKNVHMEKANRK